MFKQEEDLQHELSLVRPVVDEANAGRILAYREMATIVELWPDEVPHPCALVPLPGHPEPTHNTEQVPFPSSMYLFLRHARKDQTLSYDKDTPALTAEEIASIQEQVQTPLLHRPTLPAAKCRH